MDYSKLNRQMMLFAILILIVVFITYTRSFVNDVPSCDGYITNVYLYTLLGMLITAFSVLFIAKRRYAITNTKSLLAFCVGLISLFLMFTIDPSQVLVNHLLWMTFIVSISVSMYTIWRYSQLRGTFNSALIMTLVIFSGLTFLTYSNPNLVSLSWGSALTTAMAVGLLAWFLPMLFADVRNMRGYYRALSAVFVFIFMLMILYDTKLLRLKAANCVVPNYPSDSLGLFLDVLNLFSGLSNSI